MLWLLKTFLMLLDQIDTNLRVKQAIFGEAVMLKKNVSAFYSHFFHNVSWWEKVFWAPVHCNMLSTCITKTSKILNMLNIVPAKQ